MNYTVKKDRKTARIHVKAEAIHRNVSKAIQDGYHIPLVLVAGDKQGNGQYNVK